MPRSQHSPTFGQLASSQTVCRLSAPIVGLEPAVVRPARRRHLQPRRLAGAAEGDGALGLGRGPARLGARAGDVDAVRRASLLIGCPSVALSSPSAAGLGRRPGSRSKTSPKRLATVVGEGAEVLLGAELAGQRGHPAALDPAGDDPLERLQVVVDVDRQSVGGDPAADVDADRADLARLARLPPFPAVVPSVQIPVRPSIVSARDPVLGERRDHHPLEPPHVLVDVVAVGPQRDDRVGDELAGAVVGDAAAAVGVEDLDPLRLVPLGSHRQLIGARAAPAGVDGRVLEQQQHVGELVPPGGASSSRRWATSAPHRGGDRTRRPGFPRSHLKSLQAADGTLSFLDAEHGPVQVTHGPTGFRPSR